MKTNYAIILAGMLLLLMGISVLAFDIYGDSSFRMNVEQEVMILFGLVGGGLMIVGVGLMLEFAKRKYGIRK